MNAKRQGSGVIGQIELRRLSLRLATPFRSSRGTETAKDVLVVKVTTNESEGWGECASLTKPSYSAEYTAGAAHVIRQHLAPLILSRSGGREESIGLKAHEVAQVLSRVKGHLMAKCALETAVLDAELRAKGQSLASFLGAVRDRVPAGVAIGICGSIPELLDLVGAYQRQGYQRFKLKIEPGWDIEPVAAVRERVGLDLALQVDANSAYDAESARQLRQLDSFGLICIEQPLAEDNLVGHAQLAREITTPICLDESITSVGSAATAIALGACSVINVKAGRVGGYLEAVRIHDLCASHGVPVWCGGMLETGIGRAGNLALAALPNFTLVGDLSASERYFVSDVTEPLALDDGYLAVPSGPGLGIDVDEARLESVTTSVEYLTANSITAET